VRAQEAFAGRTGSAQLVDVDVASSGNGWTLSALVHWTALQSTLGGASIPSLAATPGTPLRFHTRLINAASATQLTYCDTLAIGNTEINQPIKRNSF
jgi:hypothetical protein